jgi:uncharacterized membrane protein
VNWKGIKWWIIGFLCGGVAMYAFAYIGAYFSSMKVGILNSKTDQLLNSLIWNIGFYCHVGFGGVALLVGWTQFNRKWRENRLGLHRLLGKIYVFCALISGTAGVYIGFFATGGIISQIGFISLGITWLVTTIIAFIDIRRLHIDQHERMMIYSYAACLAAVTLRIYLPVLILIFGEFLIAYQIVAWLCWVPNMIIAWLLVRKKKFVKAQIG